MTISPGRRAAWRRYNAKRLGCPLLTEELVERLREHQRGRCAICSVSMTTGRCCPTRECADHCHGSGLPRGLLCTSCNFALGLYEKAQRPAGLYLAPYERYLDLPPANVLDTALGPIED